MAISKNYGTSRVVVGAGYGVKDFIAQRITAVILAVYTIVLLVGVLAMPAFTFENWQALFTFTVFALPLGQILATLAFVSLAWHAWIGVRDIWMDYVKPVGVRLALQVFTIVWLVGCAGWSVQVLWRL